MSTVVVESPGLLTTVQDLGRPGFGPMGVSASGAADPLALQIANLLAGNERGAAALELTLTGGRFRFAQGAAVAVAGSDFSAQVNGRPLKLWASEVIPAGGEISFGGARTGARCYLAIGGGIQGAPFLGSASTHLASGLGGFAGRALRKGDVLQTGKSSGKFRSREIVPELIHAWQPRKTLRVTAGPQFDWFSKDAQEELFAAEFAVTEDSNRLGLRLSGPALTIVKPQEMVTEGVTLGSIQVTPSGQAIILFVEQQTTGGYAKIASVIGADCSSLGQLRPRDVVRFEAVTLERARALWIGQQELFAGPNRLFL